MSKVDPEALEYFNKGDEAYKIRQYEEALASFNKSIEIKNPNQSGFLVAKAWGYACPFNPL